MHSYFILFFSPQREPEAGSCDLTVDNLWARVDIFVVAHFVGWTVKALFIRRWVECGDRLCGGRRVGVVAMYAVAVYRVPPIVVVWCLWPV